MKESFFKQTWAQCRDFLQDGLVWMTGVALVGAANALLGVLHLTGRQMAMLEPIHVHAVYATILVTSAGTVTRLLVSALNRVVSEE